MLNELSPQTIALLITLRLVISGDVSESKFTVSLLAKSLEYNLLSNEGRNALEITLLSFCQQISAEYDRYQRKKKRSDKTSSKDAHDKVLQLKLLRVLWEIDSADLLLKAVNETYEFVAKLLSITHKGPKKVSQRSLIGRFIQSSALSFRLLHIDESSRLFSGLCTYRQSTLRLHEELERKYGATSLSNGSMCVSQISPDLNFNGSREGISQEDHSPKAGLNDQSLFENLRRNLRTMQVPDLYYNKEHMTTEYFESLIENQIQILQRYGTSAPRSLRLMFTRMAGQNILYSAGNVANEVDFPSMYYLKYLETLLHGDYRGAFDSLHRYFDYMVSKGSRYFYHFALVSKASLHQHFGEFDKALDSIEEAISVARENKDNSTLTYILSWLFDFVRQNPHLWKNRTLNQVKNELQLLATLVRKSLSISLPLAAMSHRFESEYLMNSNAGFMKYYESLFKSTYLAINDDIMTFITNCLTTSGLWNRVGVPELASLYADMESSCGSNCDRLDASSCARDPKIKNPETGFDLSDNYNKKQNQEIYKSAIRSARIFMRQGRFRFASEALNAFGHESLTQKALFERLRLSALLFSREGNHTKALETINGNSLGSLSTLCPWQSQLLNILQSRIVKSQVFIQAGKPTRAFSLILQQIKVAKEEGLLPFLLEASLLLVEVLKNNRNFSEAYTLALSVFPLACYACNDSFISLVSYELAQLSFGLLKLGEIQEQNSRRKIFNNCLHFLSVGMSGFKTSGDLNMLAKCFELESQISSASFSFKNYDNSRLLADFSMHSLRGIEALLKRSNEQSRLGYLERRPV